MKFNSCLLATALVLLVSDLWLPPLAAEDSSAMTWTPTGSLLSARIGHTATLLPGGRVLIVGGWGGSEELASVELYDPGKGAFTDAAYLDSGRTNHTATLLADGKVLVAGGQSHGKTLSDAELYDPKTGVWTKTGALHISRSYHTATRLPNGKILVVGGIHWASPPVFAQGAPPGSALDVAELYDPATGKWSVTDSLHTARYVHTATLLPNGQVLVTGGIGAKGSGNVPPGEDDIIERMPMMRMHSSDDALASAELYNPVTQTWALTGSLLKQRFNHTATLLPDGKVLVAGGQTGAPHLNSAEVYDPAHGTWSPTGNLQRMHSGHFAALLSSGQVMVAGGADDSGVVSEVELYNPSTGTWEPAASLNSGRSLFTGTLLPKGQILVAGGGNGVGSPSGIQASAELYDVATQAASTRLSKQHFAALDAPLGKWTSTGNLLSRRIGHTATLLTNGQVLIVGGYSGSNELASAELYDPGKGAFVDAGCLDSARMFHTATLLTDGQVFVVGGQCEGKTLASAVLYNPKTGTWTNTGNLRISRSYQTATLLPNGQVLVVGGTHWASPPVFGQGAPPGSALDIAELYDPATGKWTITDTLHTARYMHVATLLHDGRVLVTGGIGPDGGQDLLASAELYNPDTNTWTVTGSLPSGLLSQTACLLPNGQVLVAGGKTSLQSDTACAELYDPTRGTWTPTGNLHAVLNAHTATLLASGQVLVVGGANALGVVPNSELYNPSSGTWERIVEINTGRSFHTATLLPNGQVLVTGGGNGMGLPDGVLSSAELYTCVTPPAPATAPTRQTPPVNSPPPPVQTD